MAPRLAYFAALTSRSLTRCQDRRSPRTAGGPRPEAIEHIRTCRRWAATARDRTSDARFQSRQDNVGRKGRRPGSAGPGWFRDGRCATSSANGDGAPRWNRGLVRRTGRFGSAVELVAAGFVGELGSTRAGESAEQLAHGQRRSLGLGLLPNQRAADSGGIEVELIEQERVRHHHLDIVGLQRLSRKVLGVEGHDDLGSPRNRGGENVSILVVARHHPNQRLVVGHRSSRKAGCIASARRRACTSVSPASRCSTLRSSVITSADQSGWNTRCSASLRSVSFTVELNSVHVSRNAGKSAIWAGQRVGGGNRSVWSYKPASSASRTISSRASRV